MPRSLKRFALPALLLLLIPLLCGVRTGSAASPASEPKKGVSASARQTPAVRKAPAAPKRVVLHPKPEAPSEEPETGFRMTWKGGKLLLSFASRSRMVLQPQAPLVVQLTSEEALDLEPAVVTNTEWLPSTQSLAIAATGLKRGTAYTVKGIAAFTACAAQGQPCRKLKAPFRLTFAP
jgi:hypothetical protein